MKLQCDKCLEVFPASQINQTAEGATCRGCEVHDPSAVLPTPKPTRPDPVKVEPPRKKKTQEEVGVEEFANRELCRRHLIPFICRFKPAYKVGWVHKVFAAKLEKFLDDVVNEREPRLIVQVPPRHGKELAHSTPILTHNRGWVTHGELEVGDRVFHPSGRPTKVIALSEDSVSQYEVEFSNGDKILAHAHHEWNVYDRRSGQAPLRTVETQDIAQDVWIGQRGVRGGRARWQLPEMQGVCFSLRRLSVDPYVLGVWLGDGTTSEPCITNSEEDAAVFQEAFAGVGYGCTSVYVHSDYGTHRSIFRRTSLMEDLRSIGVFNNKHIPESYLRGSKEQRLQLLAGLVDTDGHVEAKTGRVRFVTTSPALRDGVVDLTTTLGYRPYVTEVPATISSSGIEGRNTVYTVGFQPHESLPTRLERKGIEKIALRRRVSIVNVRKTEGEPGRCIQVDASDGMYLAGRSLVPTHNSEIISNNFPSWALGKYPDLEIIMASHTLSLPIEFSRENRDRMLDERFRTVFPDSKVDPKTTSSERWRTLAKGGVKCAGVGGAIGGFGAHIMIIDDPIKDFEDAQSETIRDVAKNWYTSTAENRLAPGGGVIIVMTRWHDDDLAGARLRIARELKQEGIPDEEIEQWDVVSFPAISEGDEYLTPDLRMTDIPEKGAFHIRAPDEALHPARYPLRVLKRKRAGMPLQQWSALFQQKPVPDSGDFFTKDDFVFYDQVPEFHHYPVLFAWDLAVGEKQYNDYTVGMAGLVVPIGGLNHLFLLDHFRKRVRDKEQIDAMVNMYLTYKSNAARIGLEYGQIFLAIERRLVAEFRAKNITPPLDRELKPVRDKRVRATPARGWMQHHRIHFPKHQPWVQGVMDEMLRFDAGVHDDNVDALAWLVRMTEKMPLVTSMREKQNRGKTVRQKVEDIYRKQQLQGATSTGYMTS